MLALISDSQFYPFNPSTKTFLFTSSYDYNGLVVSIFLVHFVHSYSSNIQRQVSIIVIRYFCFVRVWISSLHEDAVIFLNVRIQVSLTVLFPDKGNVLEGLILIKPWKWEIRGESSWKTKKRKKLQEQKLWVLIMWELI